MPELPEVETVRRSLRDRLVGQQFTRVQVLSERAVRPRPPEEFSRRLVGRQILDLKRKGKYLVFHLAGGVDLIVHLRMTGRLVLVSPGTEYHKHTAVVFQLSGGCELRFVDQRKFGRMELVSEKSPPSRGYQELGVEPLDPAFSSGYLEQALAGRKARVKSLLLDQRIVAGLGNIYADEALFRARIHPQRKGMDLAAAEIRRLVRAVREVVAEGIEYRGTTVRDYVDGYGAEGQFQYRLRVYGKEGEPCPDCGTCIARVKVGGRSSYHCPRCQR